MLRDGPIESSTLSALSCKQTLEELRNPDKENDVMRLQLDQAIGIVKPAAMNILKRQHTIQSKSDLCLSPKRRPPQQAQKWRKLAAAYGNNTHDMKYSV